MLQKPLHKGNIEAIGLVDLSCVPLAEAVGADPLKAKVVADDQEVQCVVVISFDRAVGQSPQLTVQFELLQTMFCQHKKPLLCHPLTKEW